MLTPEDAAAELLLRRKIKSNLHTFAKEAWPQVEGGREFIDGWHIHAICEHLEAVYNGEIRNLLINLPPRCMKSTLVAVMYPAWCWTNNPELQFLFTTYAQNLTIRDSVNCRRLIESAWYQQRWGSLYQLAGDVNTKLRFDNTKKGYRIASSVGGANTGEGCDIEIEDDPNNVKNVESEVTRETTNTWRDQVMATRFNNPKNFARIVVQQRTHQNDVSGHILSKQYPDMVHLCLPMEFERDRRSVTVPLKSTDGIAWKDPRQEEGELLWPERIGPKELEKLKRELGGEYAIAGQFQQRPAPSSGGMIKKDWFMPWKEKSPPPLEFIIQSWDTALTADKKNAYSACTTWGVFKDKDYVSNVILLGVWRGHVEYPDLRKMAARLTKNYHDNDMENPLEGKTKPPDLILVESKVSGVSLVQDLRRMGIWCTPFNPDKHGDKIARVRLITHFIQGGRVWMPMQPPQFDKMRSYADVLIEECAVFPNGYTRDLVDTMTQVLLYLKTNGWVNHPDDEPIITKPQFDSDREFY